MKKKKNKPIVVPLELREEVLFKVMDTLDADSFKLFNEVVDLNDASMDKVEGLVMWLHELLKMYNLANDNFEELNNLELENYTYAARRFQMKRMLAAMTTVYALISNLFLGLLSFLLLNIRANKDFAKEIENIGEKVNRFDEEKLRRIESTLSNCERILYGKINRYEDNDITLKKQLN